MKKILVILVAVAALSLLGILPVSAGGATKVDNAIWADDMLFGTVLTPTELPAKGKFDKLYNFDGSGLAGQRSISEAKPGDQDYNGGRWEVMPVTFTPLGISIHDPDGDGMVNFELTSDTQLLLHQSLGHLVIGDEPIARFVCPLIKSK